MKRGLIVLVLLLLGLTAHTGYWYWPRERAASPVVDGAVYRLFASGSYDVCLWAPFPHQNLGALGAAVERWPDWVNAAVRLAGGSGAEELRSFGPFAVPPSRELVVCADREGGRIAIAARVYTGIALLARLAGRLAGNPWLSGGEAGRLTVSWDGGVWTVVGGEQSATVSGAPTAAGSPEPSLALVQVGEGLRELPPGRYRLEHRQAEFELALTGAPPAPQLQLPAGIAPPALMALVADPGTAGQGEQASAAIALFPRSAAAWSARLGSRRLQVSLPGVAIFEATGGGRRWQFPGGSLARLLSGRLERQEAAGWTVEALSADTLQQAVALAPGLAALRDTGPVIAVWADPRRCRAVVARVRQVLGTLPVAPRAQALRWADWESVLAPFAQCDRATLVSRAGAAPVFVLRLSGCAAGRPAAATSEP